MTGLTPSRTARALRRGRSWATGLAAALVVLLPAGAGAQVFFPTDPPSVGYEDDFSAPDLSEWTALDVPAGWGSGWFLDLTPPPAVAGHWGTHLAETSAVAGQQTFLLANASAGGYVNGVYELELSTDQPWTQLGAGWHIDLGTSSGYVLSFTRFPTAAQAAPPDSYRASWRLERYAGGVSQTIGQGFVELVQPVEPTMVVGGVYGLRISVFCGNFRVELREVYEVAGVMQATAWETLFEWTDPTAFDSGMVGVLASSVTGDAADAHFDNVRYSSWPADCYIDCTEWTAFDEGWVADGQTSRDRLGFKLLYEGVLEDFLNTNDIVGSTNYGRVDCEAGIDDTCDGMRLLVDLPAPADIVSNADRADQRDRVLGYLEPLASAVTFEKGSGGSFSFVQSYNDPLRADYVEGDPYDPIPINSHGFTPIDAAMMNAYDWYVGLRSGEGAWTADSLDICRSWYVILITDGEEQCAAPTAACAGGRGAALFRNPTDFYPDGTTLLPEVEVSTIGFSFQPSADSVLECVANTPQDFYVARDAASLLETLNRIVNDYQEEDRAFVPVSVAPPLTSIVAGQETDFLVTVPIFRPLTGRSIWESHVHAFKLNAATPYPPRDADGAIDTSSTAWLWDAGAALTAQLTDASPYRNLYWPSIASGSWARVALSAVKTNASRKAEFRALVDDIRVDDTVADDVVDFMYFLAADDRPAGYGALGDIWHSQPAIVGAPRNFQYLANNVDDYVSYASSHQHRRRVAFAGGNDGLLHAFDLGQYVTADQAYDTGTGQELFGVMPQTVMPKLFDLAVQPGNRQQQYMVDGPVVSADVRLDVDYAGVPGSSTPANRDWRTVLLTSMRAGGRSLLALDVTQPDTASHDGSVQPECLDAGGGCTYPYPRVMWEFTDASDADNGWSGGVCTEEEADCWDLGETWSKPSIVRVKLDGDDSMFVAFFGGGNDPEGDHTTGNFFYGVDVETGQIVYKANVFASVPGGVASLDLNDDGFADRVYFATSGGALYRLDVSAAATLASDGTEVPAGLRVTNWTLTQLYSFGADIEFFTTPVLVPALFEADGYKWALAIGSGDRANIDEVSTTVENFYFVLDYPNSDGTTPLRTESDLQKVVYDDPVAPAGTTYFKPNDASDPSFGWYLELRAGEKVSADAIVANERVQFPTFVRTPLDPSNPPLDADGNVICQASGVGRLYDVMYQNANPPDTGVEDPVRGEEIPGGMITGGTDYTVGDQTISLWTSMDGGQQEVIILGFKFHRVTNWRQE